MKKIVLGALLVLAIGIVGLVAYGGSSFTVGSGEKIDQQKSASVAQVNHLEVTMNIGEVNIKPTNNDQITAHLYGRVDKTIAKHMDLKVEKEGNTVRVMVHTPNHQKLFHIPFFNINNNDNRTLDVFIPNVILENVRVDSNIGKLHVEDNAIKNLNVSNDIGKVQVDHFSGNSLAIESNIGDVEANVENGQVDIQTDTGKVDLTITDITKDVTVQSDVGEVSVTVEKEPLNLSFDLDSGVGEVNINGFDGFQTNSHGHFQSNIGNGGPVLRVRTDVGQINIRH